MSVRLFFRYWLSIAIFFYSFRSGKLKLLILRPFFFCIVEAFSAICFHLHNGLSGSNHILWTVSSFAFSSIHFKIFLWESSLTMGYLEVCISISTYLEAHFSFSLLYKGKLILWTRWSEMQWLFVYFIGSSNVVGVNLSNINFT